MFENKVKTLVTAAAVWGVVGWLAAGATAGAAPISISATHTAGTGMGIYSKNGTTGTAVTWQWVGHKTDSSVYRYVAIFKLPDIPAGQMLQNATFSIPLSSITGTPVGDAVLLHLRTVNQPKVAASFFQAASAVQLPDALTSFVTPTSPKAIYSLDVTDAVKGDYSNDPANARYAAFRIEIPSDSDTSGTSDDYYKFSDSMLTVTLVPEPAGLSVLGLAGLALLRRRKGA